MKAKMGYNVHPPYEGIDNRGIKAIADCLSVSRWRERTLSNTQKESIDSSH